jgi:hypothetical protein
MCTCSGSCNCNSATIPKGPQGATGATGAQGVQGLPGENGTNGNYVVQTVEPAGVNCPAGGVKIEVFNGVDDTLINTTYVCNSYTEGFFGLAKPENLAATPFNTLDRRVISGQIQILTIESYDDQNAYNPVTGVWTCPETGRYDLSFYAHYSGPTGNPWTEGGYFIAGICVNNDDDVYVASTHYIGPNTLYVEVSGSFNGLILTSGTELVFKVNNCTEDNYVSTVGDIVKMSIRKVG